MDQTVREFLRARLDLIDDYNLRQIYEDADMFLISSDIKQVIQALIDAGINPINYLNRIPSYFYSNDTKITDVTIPSNIKHLGRSCYGNCDNLVKVDITEGVRTLATRCFESCLNLRTVTLPQSIEMIGPKIFADCPSLHYLSYSGTKSDWYKIKKVLEWRDQSSLLYVDCIDGRVKFSRK